MCPCVCACVCARVCVRVCACACVCVQLEKFLTFDKNLMLLSQLAARLGLPRNDQSSRCRAAPNKTNDTNTSADNRTTTDSSGSAGEEAASGRGGGGGGRGGLVRLWVALQSTLCGQQSSSASEHLTQSAPDQLNISQYTHPLTVHS